MFTVSVIFVLGVLALSYIRIAPRMGSTPNKSRQQRLAKSDQFKDGKFTNKLSTNMDRPPFEGIREMMRKDPSRRPSRAINNVALNRNAFSLETNDKFVASWLGHSTLLMKMGTVTLLTDPVFTKRASMSKYLGPKKFDFLHDYQVNELPPVQLVLISHDHYDHLDFEAVKRLSQRVDYFVMPLGVGAHFEKWNIQKEKIVELDWWESFAYKELKITATPARHFSGRGIKDRFKTLWCGFAIQSDQANVCFTGDSGYFDGFSEIGEKLGPFDISFVECGQYSQYWPEIHMHPEQSVQAGLDLKSSVAMPIHWGKFSLSIHAWNEPPLRFTKAAQENKLNYLLPRIGQVFVLSELPKSKWYQ